jgi:hypothetical protein
MFDIHCGTRLTKMMAHFHGELFALYPTTYMFCDECPRKGKENAKFAAMIPVPKKFPDELQAALPFWIPFFVKLRNGDRWRLVKREGTNMLF